MNKYLLVINAGSSSIKFAIYQKDTSTAKLVADAAGQIEEIGNQPRFTVKTPDAVVLVDRNLSVDEAHNHTGAITVILAWLKVYFAEGELLAVGHRVVHGGQHYSVPVLINETVLAELETLIPLVCPRYLKSPALIRRFITPSPLSHNALPCPNALSMKGFDVTDSTVYPTNT
jgi:acetate kinase